MHQSRGVAPPLSPQRMLIGPFTGQLTMEAFQFPFPIQELLFFFKAAHVRVPVFATFARAEMKNVATTQSLLTDPLQGN